MKRKPSIDSIYEPMQKKLRSASHAPSFEKNRSNLIERPSSVPPIKSNPKAWKEYNNGKFDLSKEGHIAKYEQEKRRVDSNYTYNRETNKNITKIKLKLSSVHVLGNGLGIFAGEDIIPSDNFEENCIGYYAGKRDESDEDENEKSQYVFQFKTIDTEKLFGKVITIDGEIDGDWTALINCSQVPNVIAIEKIIDGKPQICFYVVKPIKKGEQLLFDYGDEFFMQLAAKKITPLFLHEEDSCLSPNEVYSNNKKRYEKKLYQFDDLTCNGLHLTTNSWLIPTIFKLISNNEYEKLTQVLSAKNDNYPVDLFAYACDDEKILESTHQQQLSALMYACYLGQEKCVQILLDYGADPNRCMLVEGYLPLTLLLLGNATDEQVNRIGKKLLQRMGHPLVRDKYNLNILHYAIKRNCPELVKEILEIANGEDQLFDVYKLMFKRQKDQAYHADLDYCLLNNQFDIFRILLEDLLKKDLLVNYVKDGYIFKPENLAMLSKNQLLTLKNILTELKFDDFMTLNKLNQLIYDIPKSFVFVEEFNRQTLSNNNSSRPISLETRQQAPAKKESHKKIAEQYCMAAHRNDVAEIKRLIKIYPNSDKYKCKNKTPAYYAAAQGNIEVLNELLQSKVDINVCMGRYNLTVFQNAVLNNNVEVAKELLNYGVHDINKLCATNNFTPLFLATMKGSFEMVNLLLEHNANPTIPWKVNIATLKEFANKQNPECKKRFMKLIAAKKVSSSTKISITASEIAIAMEYYLIASMLDIKALVNNYFASVDPSFFQQSSAAARCRPYESAIYPTACPMIK